jgi:hypothetical protein
MAMDENIKVAVKDYRGWDFFEFEDIKDLEDYLESEMNKRYKDKDVYVVVDYTFKEGPAGKDGYFKWVHNIYDMIKAYDRNKDVVDVYRLVTDIDYDREVSFKLKNKGVLRCLL